MSSSAAEGGKPRYCFRLFVNLNPSSLQTKEREAVEVSLPISMHAGQIIMLTKMMTADDLRFYDFEADAPVERWHSGPPSSS